MNHQEINEQGIIERYIRDQLDLDERRAFQEHFFDCDRCFDEVQAMARFVASVRQASKVGLLSAEIVHSPEPRRFSFGWPAFAIAGAVMVLMAGGLLWLGISQLSLREELARGQAERDEIRQGSERQIAAIREQFDEQARQLAAEHDERLKSEEKASLRPESSTSSSPQANVPVVTLDSTRDASSSANRVSIPASAGSLIIWVSVEGNSRFDSFQVDIMTSEKLSVESVGGARPNQYGALTVSVPSARFESGQYTVQVYGQKGSRKELVGDYNLRVIRQP